jgi:hypothetical protein
MTKNQALARVEVIRSRAFRTKRSMAASWRKTASAESLNWGMAKVNKTSTCPAPDQFRKKATFNFGRGSLPTHSVSRELSREMICDTLATESFGSPVARVDKPTLPGASAHFRLLVSGTQTTVEIRLWLSASFEQLPPACETPGRKRWGRANLPTRSLLARSPLALLQPSSRGRRYEGIVALTYFSQSLIHGLGDSFGRTAVHIFAQGIAKEPAPRLSRAPRKAFRHVEKFIRNGDCRFHTESMTKLRRLARH